MNLSNYINPSAEEKPLDNLSADGGLCCIFRAIGCIGDSLSSGEFESENSDGTKGYHDYYEYSWGQYIARSTGAKVYNFSRGGMSASEYWNSFAQENDFWNPDKLCQAYIIALGVNDLIWQKQELGSLQDIDLENYEKNADTFAGYYGRIIQRLKTMQPHARFFFMTMPREGDEYDTIRESHAKLLREMADFFDYSYVIDLFQYAPVYDEAFKRRYFLRGHMNPAGYVLTARMTESYIDFIVRHHPEDFSEVGFIGTPYHL
jgi:lysophospholipase L1-like esterase